MNRLTGQETRLAAAFVRLNLFRCEDGSLHAHWTPEDRALFERNGFSDMVFQEEVAAVEQRA